MGKFRINWLARSVWNLYMFYYIYICFIIFALFYSLNYFIHFVIFITNYIVSHCSEIRGVLLNKTRQYSRNSCISIRENRKKQEYLIIESRPPFSISWIITSLTHYHITISYIKMVYNIRKQFEAYLLFKNLVL